MAIEKETICTSDAEFAAETKDLKEQGFSTIAPNFDLLKNVGQSIEATIKAKIILAGKTNERSWQLCLLDFSVGRISVVNPSEFPIGSTCKITFNGMVKNNKDKPVKDFTVSLLQAEKAETPEIVPQTEKPEKAEKAAKTEKKP